MLRPGLGLELRELRHLRLQLHESSRHFLACETALRELDDVHAPAGPDVEGELCLLPPKDTDAALHLRATELTSHRDATRAVATIQSLVSGVLVVTRSTDEVLQRSSRIRDPGHRARERPRANWHADVRDDDSLKYRLLDSGSLSPQPEVYHVTCNVVLVDRARVGRGALLPHRQSALRTGSQGNGWKCRGGQQRSRHSVQQELGTGAAEAKA